MTHGDDDGLRTPPAIAPRQVVIVPMLRGKPEDADLKAYCAALAAELNTAIARSAARVRAYVDTQGRQAGRQTLGLGAPRRAVDLRDRPARRRRWQGHASCKRNALREGEKIKSHTLSTRRLRCRGARTSAEACKKNCSTKPKRGSTPTSAATSRPSHDLERYYGTDDEEGEFKGWARVRWSRPTGAALEEVGERLKALEAHHPQCADARSPALRRRASSPARRP